MESKLPRLTVPAVLALYLIVPGHPLTFLNGLPWGPPSLTCAVLLAVGTYAAWPLARVVAARWLALAALLLVVTRLVLAVSAPPYGLEASYYANDRFNNVPESSTVTPGTDYTRLDLELDFGSDEFPLFFFNDSERFNMLGAERFERARVLTWSAIWRGFLNAPTDRPVTLWLTASGPGEMSLDGKTLWKVDAEGRATAQQTVVLAAGPHPIEVRYARRRERSGFLQVASDLTGARRPLAPPFVSPRPYQPDRLASDANAAAAARGVDSGFLALLLLHGVLSISSSVRERWRSAAERERGNRAFLAIERPLLASVAVGFFLQAALPRLDRYGKMVFLGGGQDWLTHETLARDIQFNGPLMTLGKPLGQGALYYAQPFYPYYLAFLHTLSGEDLFGVVSLQVLGLGVACVLAYSLARLLFGIPTAIVTLALLLVVMVPFEFAWVSRLLISEALFFTLLPAAILATLASVRRGAGRQSTVLAGLLLGLCAVTRGPMLLYLPPAGLLVWRIQRTNGATRREAGLTLFLIGLAAAAVISLVPLRNLLVAGQPALTASSGGVNMEKLHRPPRHIRLSGVDDDPVYEALRLDHPTREVLEYVRQDPSGYFLTYFPLAGYTVGFGFALNGLLEERPVQLQPELLALNVLYLLAIMLVPAARSARTGLLHAYVGVHFLTMLVFAPYDYENRLVTPMYILVTIVAASAIAHLSRLRWPGATETTNLAASSVARLEG